MAGGKFSFQRAWAAAMAVCLAFGPAVPLCAKGEGKYETLPLHRRERNLIDGATEAEDLFARRGYRYASPEIEAMLERVGNAIAPPSTDPYIRYKFFILRDPIPNAFAMPNGHVYVYTGMLAALENEAQLAALIGHEVNHVAGHHGVLSYRSIRRKIIGYMIFGPILGQLTFGVSDIFFVLAIYGYSRDLEEEADRMALDRVLAAGYDPREIPRMYEIMNEDPEGERARVKTKWSTHPQLEARAKYMREMVAGLGENFSFAGLKLEKESYRALVHPLALDTVDDLIRADYPRSAVDMARQLLAEDGADARGWFLMGEACAALDARKPPMEGESLTDKEKRRLQREREEMTREERQKKRLEQSEGEAKRSVNLDEAAAAYRKALALDPGLAEARRGLGFALFASGCPAEGGAELLAYLRMRPDAPDKAAVLACMKEIAAALKEVAPGGEAAP